MNTKSKPEKSRILLVDDEENFLLIYRTVLEAEGWDDITSCSDSRQVMDRLSKEKYDLVLLDLTMPYVSGMELLPKITQSYPGISVVVITGTDETEVAVECMKNGAHDYLVKPVSKERLVTTVRHTLHYRAIQNEIGQLRRYIVNDDLEHPENFDQIVTGHKKMHALFCYVEAVAPSPAPVLIAGETGTGKELFAHSVHNASKRQGPFVAVNVAGLDDNIFSDTLFGHRRGAFTGADNDRAGMIESAAGGTLFLDEIGDMTIASQIKLLRLLQEGEYFRLGEDFPRQTDARIVVATNQNLDTMQQEGKFRKDLYYRLCTHRIDLPPLRERIKDVSTLLDHFLDKVCRQTGRKIRKIPRTVITLLEQYSFPGNVRELEGMVYDGVLKHKNDEIAVDAFKTHMKRNGFDVSSKTLSIQPGDSPAGQQIIYGEQLPALKNSKRLLIEEALRRTGGNKSQAAQLLNTSRQALNYWSV